MRWLAYLGEGNIIRINSDDQSPEIQQIALTVDERTFSFYYKGSWINLSEIGAVWYRKGRHWFCTHVPNVAIDANPALATYLRKKLAKEQLRLSEYLHHLISKTLPSLGSAPTCDLNKLIVLHAALEVGLNVPAFTVSNSESILSEATETKQCITKPIGDVVYLFDNERTNTGYFSYTEDLDPRTLRKSSKDNLPCSLVQQKIDKQFDARVFYLDGRCFAMAILSQRDEQTKTDFRRYNSVRPNRSVPLRLKPEIENKVVTLFTKLGLNTGSADFVIDQEGRYFFLEINPVGQFGMVSMPCNYYLEKHVALALRDYARRG